MPILSCGQTALEMSSPRRSSASSAYGVISVTQRAYPARPLLRVLPSTLRPRIGDVVDYLRQLQPGIHVVDCGRPSSSMGNRWLREESSSALICRVHPEVAANRDHPFSITWSTTSPSARRFRSPSSRPRIPTPRPGR